MHTTKSLMGILTMFALVPVITYATWGGSATSYIPDGLYQGAVTFSGGDTGEGDFLIECPNWSGSGEISSLWTLNGGSIDTGMSFGYSSHFTDSINASFRAASGTWQSIEVAGFLIDADGTLSAVDY